ncbi:MAG: hypothetical protein ACLUI3_17640, partial [Christensenellales bacterium]
MVHTPPSPSAPSARSAEYRSAERRDRIRAIDTDGGLRRDDRVSAASRAHDAPAAGIIGAGELAGQGMESFDAMRRALAAAGYNRQDDFARVLLLASPRMRRTGSVAVFSTRLTPAIADAALALSRMGARMRYTLVTAGETTEEQAKLLNLLRVSGVE